jgi:hypothetical protein
MSLKILSQPYPFSHEDLKSHMSAFDPASRSHLEKKVADLAVADGVAIEDWDKGWGHHHLFENTARLVNALVEKKKRDLLQSVCSDKKADLIFSHCPIVVENLLSNKADAEIVQRAQIIARLENLKDQLNARYALHLCASENESPLTSAWKAVEMHYLTCPTFLSLKQTRRLSYFTTIVEELLNGNYDPISVEIILGRLMTKESFHPTSADLGNALHLKSLKRMVKEQINHRCLQTAGESLWKPIYTVPSAQDKHGKFKPLQIEAAMREVYASHIDRLCGIGMTAPTELLDSKNFFESVCEVKELLRSAQIKCLQKKCGEAEPLRKKAFSLLNVPHIPEEVRNQIYGKMYAISGNGRCVEELGQKLFYNEDGYATTDREKALAIENYFNSDAFKDHLHAFNVQGSIQPWIHHCGRAYELMVKDPTGGEKLRTAPKVLAHLYALLGILKGSKDCSSGNTLVDYSSSLGRVVNFWDFDDENSLTAGRDFKEFRMWHLGLPQCRQPFDRALLLMFSDPCLLNKLKKQQTSLQIPEASYEAQRERLEGIIAIFKSELAKGEITLTPRSLFFKMFGGQERFNEVYLSPIEIFEFYMSNIGIGAVYTHFEEERWRFNKNMHDLFS